jgi:hypothetical protein
MKIERLLLLKLFIVILLLCVTSTVNSQSLLEQRLMDRNYERGPVFNDYDSRFPPSADPYAENGLSNRMRDFLWKMWDEKRLTYFVLNSYTLEGKQILCIFSTQKGSNNNWSIIQECDAIEVCPYISKTKCERYRYTKITFDSVKRSELPSKKYRVLLRNRRSGVKAEF